MNLSEQLFPFDKIPQGSRVILYGLGTLGRQYLRQIAQLHWCTVVGGMDRSARAEDWDIPILSIDAAAAMPRSSYDCIIISIKNEKTVRSVQAELERHGIAQETILSLADRAEAEADDAAEDGTPLKVLLYLTGGVGDGVTDLAIYARLVELVPDVIIDIYGEPFIRFLYKQKENVRNIFDYHHTTKMPEGYDLVLRGSWYLSVLSCRHVRLKTCAPALDALVRAAEREAEEGAAIGTWVHRARILGKDKFWLMGHGGRWGITPEKIRVDMDAAFAASYRSLGLKTYITINCGADMRRMEAGDVPTKIWPAAYFGRFIALFHARFPMYDVVQLGAKTQAKIAGADHHLMGEPFELVSYILRSSRLHIDDESGLVHLATALGTKCIGLFGPTKPDVFGYPQNINLCTDICESCAYDVPDWNKNCLRGAKHPPCMYSLTPELVMEHVAAYLEGLRGDAL